MNVSLNVEKIGISQGIVCSVYWKAAATEGEEVRSHSFSTVVDDYLTPEYFIEVDENSNKYYAQAYLWTITNLSDIHSNLVNELIDFLYNR